MEIFTDEFSLPGSLTEIRPDYSFGYDSSQFGTTDSVLIVGTAFNGPSGVPVPIYSPEHGYYVFGKAYDNETKQEATLVSGIEDAYQKGCRTIYGMRVSGKNVEKKYNLIAGGLKLKVSSRFPSRDARNCFMVYDDTPGDETVRILKPASRATIEEKMTGVVESDDSVIEVKIRLNFDYNINRNSDIFEAIQVINNHVHNNVLLLSIVDGQGIEILPQAGEGKSVKLGHIFPGAYIIGRDQNLCAAFTDVQYILVEDQVPFTGFIGNTYRKLVLNTDIAQPYPIYAQHYSNITSVMRDVQIVTASGFDFLKTSGLVDRAFKQDEVDYEEVTLSDFELYKRLGSGFAVTARAERRITPSGRETVPRIIEAPVEDPNRVISIPDGIYSTLEEYNARYRVLVSAYANKEIQGKIPRAADFLEAMPVPYYILDGYVEAKSRVNAQSRFEPKKYRFDFIAVTSEEIEEEVEKIKSSLYSNQIMKIVPVVSDIDELANKKYENGTLVLCDDKLYRYSGEEFVVQEDTGQTGKLYIANGLIYKGIETDGEVSFEGATILPDADEFKFEGKNYVLAEASDDVHIMKVVGVSGKHVEFVGDTETLLSDTEEKLMVFAPSNHIGDNRVIIKYNMFDVTTLGELVDALNSHKVLSSLFEFKVASNVLNEINDFVAELVPLKEVQKTMLSLESNYPFTADNLIFDDGIVNISLPALDSGRYVVDEESGRIYFKATGEPLEEEENEFNYRPSYGAPESASVPFIVELPEEYEITGILYTHGELDKEPGSLDHHNGEENTAIVTVQVAKIKGRSAGKVYALTDWELVSEEHVIEIIAVKDGVEENFVVRAQIEFSEDRVVQYNYSKYIPYRTSDNFVRQLAQHCTYTSLKTAPTHGIIGHMIVADQSLESISRLVEDVVQREFDLYAKNAQGRNMLDRENMPYPIGRNVSVTLMQYAISTRTGYTLVSNGAAGYAGMLSVLPLDRSSTNQPINVTDPQFNFSKYHLGRLTQKGYVTLRRSYTSGIVVTDGVTMAPPESPFKRLSATRVIGAVEELIREATEPFIGKQNTPANRNAMHTAIKSKLETIKNTLIENYDFNMLADPRSLRFSYVDIDYRIIPIHEIREVRNRITIKESLA